MYDAKKNTFNYFLSIYLKFVNSFKTTTLLRKHYLHCKYL